MGKCYGGSEELTMTKREAKCQALCIAARELAVLSTNSLGIG